MEESERDNMKVVEISVEQFDSIYIAEKLNNPELKMLNAVYYKAVKIVGHYFLINRDRIWIEYHKIEGIEDSDIISKVSIEELTNLIIREIYEIVYYEDDDIYICLNDYVRESVMEYCKKNELEYIDERI